MKEFKDYFSKSEIVLWSSSVMVIIISFCVFDRINYMTLCASLIGVTSLIFNAKGNPFGQLLMVVFSLLYGIISYTFSYYGEMITYLGMTMPMAIFALISWLKNPYNGNKAEVKVNSIGKRENVCIDTAYVERMAQQLATVRNEFVRETVNSHERTRYQPNPIYARQANEIESVAKTVAEQSRTIEAFKAERDKLGMFKGKEKKEIQGKIDNFERLRRSNLDKLKALGVSNLSKADEAAKEKRTLAAQEQKKAQAARRNEGAGSRAEEAKQVFLEAAKRIPADQRQAVLERMEQYNSHEAGGMEVFKAEIEARRVLDSALKEQTQDREHEKTKVKGRGRTD